MVYTKLPVREVNGWLRNWNLKLTCFVSPVQVMFIVQRLIDPVHQTCNKVNYYDIVSYILWLIVFGTNCRSRTFGNVQQSMSVW